MKEIKLCKNLTFESFQKVVARCHEHLKRNLIDINKSIKKIRMELVQSIWVSYKFPKALITLINIQIEPLFRIRRTIEKQLSGKWKIKNMCTWKVSTCHMHSNGTSINNCYAIET